MEKRLSGCQDDARFNTHNVNKVSTKSCSKKPKNGFISKFLNALESDPFCIMLAFLKRKQTLTKTSLPSMRRSLQN